MRHVLAPAFALLLVTALLPAASAATTEGASTCPDPRNGPFDPCFWNCEPGWEPECEIILGAGQAVWHYYCDRISRTC